MLRLRYMYSKYVAYIALFRWRNVPLWPGTICKRASGSVT